MKEMLAEMAQKLREAYPDAVGVELFVNHQGFDIEVKYRQKEEGVSMRSLNGEWIK